MEAVTGARAAVAADVVEAAGRRVKVRRPRRYILSCGQVTERHFKGITSSELSLQRNWKSSLNFLVF